jgi:hypothetical protein
MACWWSFASNIRKSALPERDANLKRLAARSLLQSFGGEVGHLGFFDNVTGDLAFG